MQPDERALLVDIHARVRSIEDRFQVVAEIEKRLREIEGLKDLEGWVEDHEKRIRTVERAGHYAMGVAAAVGAGISWVLATLKDRLFS